MLNSVRSAVMDEPLNNTEDDLDLQLKGKTLHYCKSRLQQEKQVIIELQGLISAESDAFWPTLCCYLKTNRAELFGSSRPALIACRQLQQRRRVHHFITIFVVIAGPNIYILVMSCLSHLPFRC